MMQDILQHRPSFGEVMVNNLTGQALQSNFLVCFVSIDLTAPIMEYIERREGGGFA